MALRTSVSPREYRQSSGPSRLIIPKELTSSLILKNNFKPARYVLMHRNGAVNLFGRLEIETSTVMLSVRSATNPSQQTCPPRSSQAHDTHA
jgi:hypothetical protein